MSPITDRVARVRERVAAHHDREAARQEHLRRLPEAICAACGGVVRAGEGTREGTGPWGSDDDRHQWTIEDQARKKAGLPRVDAWRRRHDECATTPQIMGALIGEHDLSPQIAATVLNSLNEPLLARERAKDATSASLDNRMAKPRPWAWIGDREIALLRRAVDRARAAVEPRRCRDGACGWCGVSESIGWHAGPARWSDGSAAPLCRACSAVWTSRGKPTDEAGARACALEALSGANGIASDGLGIRTYADIAGDDHGGTNERWAYAPAALDALTERARLTWPGSLPPDIRDEYRAAAAREQRAAQAAVIGELDAAERQRAEAEAEAARQAGWPI